MLLAFFLNLVREIIKDIQDIEGDSKSYLITLPIYIGLKKTIIIIRSIYLVFFIVSFMPMYTQVYAWQYIPLLVFLIHVPLLYISVRLNDDITKEECDNFSKILKIIIINGIIIILISAN
jgi:4-hydroxybenzoate polyprenyltransferase